MCMVLILFSLLVSGILRWLVLSLTFTGLCIYSVSAWKIIF